MIFLMNKYTERFSELAAGADPGSIGSVYLAMDNFVVQKEEIPEREDVLFSSRRYATGMIFSSKK